MNVASLTIYISQITFGLIFVFALTSFIIYKVKGKNRGNVLFQEDIELKKQINQAKHFERNTANSNVVSYSVETVPGTERVVSKGSISRSTFSSVTTTAKSMNNRSRFTVMNNTFEQAVEKSRAQNNWA